MRSNTELIGDLENDFLYEIQHISFYPGNGTIVNEKYFWQYELELLIERGKKIYGYENETPVILYAAIRALQSLVKDDKSRMRLIFGSKRKAQKVQKSFKDLVREYKTILKEYIPVSNYKNLIKVLRP